MQRISRTAGLPFVKGFESFVAYVYDDLVPAQRIGGRLVYRQWRRGDPIRGTLTIGYGHTDAAKYDLGCALADLPADFRLTEQQAADILDIDLDECEEAINRLVKVEITQGMFDAVVSLTFNMGEGNLRKSSLLAKLNRGDYAGARAAFDLYVKSKGKTLRGLQRRRDGEQDLWDANVPTAPAEPVDHPAEVDEDDVPPPPANMAQSSEGNAAITVGTGGAATTAVLVSNAVKGAASAKTFTTTGFLIALASQPEFWLSVFAAVVLIGGPAYLWLKRRHKLVTQGV
ncbi:MAG: lysozyme [Hyphomicrobium sp.]|uniref:lysozyme n=1 Tax=Hyphomicrobium sp. TaxID=82 RepID=UPI003D14CD09